MFPLISTGLPLGLYADSIETARDRVAIILSNRRNYERQLSGECAARHSPEALRAKIARCDESLTKLRGIIGATDK